MAQLFSVFKNLRPLEVTLNIMSTWTATNYPCIPPIWFGVICGSIANGSQTSGAIVIGLNLAGLGLTGTMPLAMSMLTTLQSIDFSLNLFTGPMTSSYSSLRQLSRMDLHDNLLSGSLPISYSAMSQISPLDLNSNQLVGPLPPLLFGDEQVVFPGSAYQFNHKRSTPHVFSAEAFGYLQLE